MEAKALVNTLLDMRKDVEAKTLGKTLGYVGTKAMFNFLAITTAEAYAETLWPDTTRCQGRDTDRHDN